VVAVLAHRVGLAALRVTRRWAGSDDADPAHRSSHGEGGIFPQGNMGETVRPCSHCWCVSIRLSDPTCSAYRFILWAGRPRTPWSNWTNCTRRRRYSMVTSPMTTARTRACVRLVTSSFWKMAAKWFLVVFGLM
jgi:hypothetical protein